MLVRETILKVCICARVCVCSLYGRVRAHTHTNTYTYTYTNLHQPTHTPTPTRVHQHGYTTITHGYPYIRTPEHVVYCVLNKPRCGDLVHKGDYVAGTCGRHLVKMSVCAPVVKNSAVAYKSVWGI